VTVLTVTPARTLGDLKARIADELSRSDLTSQIALAVDDAIDVACKNRFWFNEVRGQQIVLNSGEQYYSDADTDVLVEIDNLYLLLNSNYHRNLHATSAARHDKLYNGTPAVGEPQSWSRYGTELRFYPTPSQAYTIVIDGLTRGPPMEDDTDSTIWTTYGEKYVRAVAKTLLYAEIIRDSEAAERADQLAQRYLLDLQAQTESRTMTGEMEAFGV
jgi:hypothetical protein